MKSKTLVFYMKEESFDQHIKGNKTAILVVSKYVKKVRVGNHIVLVEYTYSETDDKAYPTGRAEAFLVSHIMRGPVGPLHKKRALISLQRFSERGIDTWRILSDVISERKEDKTDVP